MFQFYLGAAQRVDTAVRDCPGTTFASGDTYCDDEFFMKNDGFFI